MVFIAIVFLSWKSYSAPWTKMRKTTVVLHEKSSGARSLAGSVSKNRCWVLTRLEGLVVSHVSEVHRWLAVASSKKNINVSWSIVIIANWCQIGHLVGCIRNDELRFDSILKKFNTFFQLDPRAMSKSRVSVSILSFLHSHIPTFLSHLLTDVFRVVFILVARIWADVITRRLGALLVAHSYVRWFWRNNCWLAFLFETTTDTLRQCALLSEFCVFRRILTSAKCSARRSIFPKCISFRTQCWLMNDISFRWHVVFMLSRKKKRYERREEQKIGTENENYFRRK